MRITEEEKKEDTRHHEELVVEGGDAEPKKVADGPVEPTTSSTEHQENEGNVIKTDEQSVSSTDQAPVSCWTCVGKALCTFYSQQDFLVQIVIAILLAFAYPELGAIYLKPKITASWIAVIFIFFLSGWGLPTEHFAKSIIRWRFNLLVQTYCFGVDSVFVFGISQLLLHFNAISKPLADGLVVCASLSVSINVAIILTTNSGGDRAAAIFNTAVGNLLGVVLSPLLILGYLGVTGDVNLPVVFTQLTLKVVVPLFVGQCVRRAFKWSVTFYDNHARLMKKSQQLALVYIVYTTFCSTFLKQSGAVGAGEIVVVIFVVIGCFLFLFALAWTVFGFLYKNEPKLRIAGLFGSTQKTISLGVPLINSMYGGDPNVALITLPLLIWFNLQLILGTIVTPKLLAWGKREEERLAGETTVSDDASRGEDAKGNQANDREPVSPSIAPAEVVVTESEEIDV